MKKTVVIKKILVYIHPYRALVFLSLLFAAASVFLTLYIPILVGKAIDLIIGPGKVDVKGVSGILITSAVVIAATSLFQWLMTLCNNKITNKTVQDIRNAAFRKIQTLPLKYIDSHSHGDVVSRVISDADQFADGLLMGFTQFFTGILTIFGTFAFMLSVNAGITAVVVVLTPVSLFAAGFISKRTYSMFRLQSEIRGKQTSLIEEMIGNQKTVQAFGYENEALNRFDEINEQLSASSLKAIFYSSITNPSTRFVNSLVYAGVTIFGALTALSGGISIGRLSCFLSYANQFTKPFNEISGVVTELQNALACADRIFTLLEEPPENPDKSPAADLSKVEGKVTLEQVEFSYTPGTPFIKNLNLIATPGQRIAITGPTGCGKTTLINLLMRFYEADHGKIRIDGTDICDMSRENLRAQYGMVLQDTWLQTGTIRENIILGKPDATEAEILEACKAAHAHNFIKRLPHGYDTQITSEGAGLSQGEKQLLCIARVMLCLPPMLILDEATSSIDTRTEMKIQEAFARLMQGRTSFIVAHRLSTIREADVILVMKNGQIVEQGNHISLMEKKGDYSKMYLSQFLTD